MTDTKQEQDKELEAKEAQEQEQEAEALEQLEAEPIGPGDVEMLAESIMTQSMQIAASAKEGGPIRIPCEIDEHKKDFVEFVRKGWKFKHLREYEDALGMGKLSAVVCSRIESWKFTVDGEHIPFAPKPLRKQLAALPEDSPDRPMLEKKIAAAERTAVDELPGYLAAFVWAAFRTAYNVASALGPNA
jgi:hypothetical protein